MMRHALLAVTTLVVTLVVPAAVQAGPPLICHPFDIGTARSLPIGPADGGWSAIDRSYDKSKLVSDTLALLTPETPTIVRMETLRRATMYVADDEAGAKGLLQALRDRAAKSPASRAEALTLFDVGYLVETYRQLGTQKRGLSMAAGDIDGYTMVTTAMKVVKDDPSLHFAAALMTANEKGTPKHREHLRQARAATNDALLARNVRTHLVG